METCKKAIFNVRQETSVFKEGRANNSQSSNETWIWRTSDISLSNLQWLALDQPNINMSEPNKSQPSPYFQEFPKKQQEKLNSAIIFNLTRQQFFERMQGVFTIILHLKQRNANDVFSGFKSALVCLFQEEPALLDALCKDAEMFYQTVLKKYYDELEKNGGSDSKPNN